MRIGINAISLEGRRKGEGRYLTNILKEWIKNFKKDEFILYLRSSIQNDSFFQSRNVHQLLIKWPFKRPLRPVWEHIMLPMQIWKDDLDIFFSPSYTLPCITLPCPKVLVLHDISYDVLHDHLEWKAKMTRKLFSRVSAQKSDFIITISEFSKKEIIKFYKVPETKIRVVYLASDKNFCLVNNEYIIKEFKRFNRLSDNFILYVGTMFKRRNIDSLIRAFIKIKKRFSQMQLVLVGEIVSSEINNIMPLIRNNAIGNSIVHYKFVSDEYLKMLYNSADVMVYPSSYEGFGLPPLEAMACGTPVIVGNSSSLPEVVGNAGILVDPTSPKEIAHNICRVLLDCNLRKELIEKGLKQAKKFSWTKCAIEVRKTFDKVLCQYKKA